MESDDHPDDDLDDEQREFVRTLELLAAAHATTDRARSAAHADATQVVRAEFAERARQGLLDGCAAGERMGIPAAVINRAIASGHGIHLA